uniref:Uncharacterized protein n=1 Tax=Anguilla anguilla TaxID=7936 RepID=A0A0E9PEP3_ANGAN
MVTFYFVIKLFYIIFSCFNVVLLKTVLHFVKIFVIK